MSWKAAGFVKEQLKCPDGAPLSRGQKLILFVLADYHDTTKRVSFPSVPTIAEQALSSLPQTKRDLAYLVEHMAIARVRNGRGRGANYEYQFVGLDISVDEVRAQHSQQSAEGVHGEPFISDVKGSPVTPFCPDKRGSDRDQKGFTTNTEKGSQGVQGERRYKEEPEPNPKPEPERGCAAARGPVAVPLSQYTQADFDERDYRRLCEARTELLRREKPRPTDTGEYCAFVYPEVEGTSQAEFDELVRRRAGLTPKRFTQLLSMYEPAVEAAQ